MLSNVERVAWFGVGLGASLLHRNPKRKPLSHRVKKVLGNIFRRDTISHEESKRFLREARKKIADTDKFLEARRNKKLGRKISG